MFSKVLIANRGAIACRIIRTLRRMNIASVAVYSEADRDSLHVAQADEAFRIGPAPARASYLDPEKLIAVAKRAGAQAIHPGYGFLSENADFAEACNRAGVVFIGPTPDQMRAFGLKHRARALAEQHGMPLLPGSDLIADLSAARGAAERIGYPVMLKSTAGGGGIGMQLCANETELIDGFASVQRLAVSNFSQGGVFLEKYIAKARHIEVQVFGDGVDVVTLGERDCSIQRRNQKVIEETPAPGLSDSIRDSLADTARKLCAAVKYRSAGTVEFVYDRETDRFYFLEMNTRLQVEHGVTEEVSGIDLVEWMIRVAAGQSLPKSQGQLALSGHSIQARLYAEDPAANYRPSSGPLTAVAFPQDARVETWVRTGSEVSPHYDPMLAKIIVNAPTRAAALSKLDAALANTRVNGIESNLEFLRSVVNDEVFVAGKHFTRYLASLNFIPKTIQVLQPGTHTTVQDYPGRVGFWDVGVPPSGPMDSFAFRIANRLVDNGADAAALEMTVTGPTLRFNFDTHIALTGAHMTALLNDEPIDYWRAIEVKAGSVLKLRGVKGGGQRAYLSIRGGFDVPLYMNSASTFTLGQFGGHAGRALRVGDTLRSKDAPTSTLPRIAGEGAERYSATATLDAASVACQTVDTGFEMIPSPGHRGRDRVGASWIPHYENHWDILVMYGPHGAPDFFTREDIDMIFATDWQVHYNSSRTGVRLIGPKPRWARADGGEAGLHPSNIHDNAYAIGAIDFTGDMPVILGPDGPSLGGFVCPATIIHADLWKIGQLRPGDTVRLHAVTAAEATALENVVDAAIDCREDECMDEARTVYDSMRSLVSKSYRRYESLSPILKATAERDGRVAVCYRQAGDKYLLIEYGPPVLDLELRFRVHALMEHIANLGVPGVLELTPGIRSLQVHYDSRRISQAQLLDLLTSAEDRLPSIDNLEVPSRIVHLPLSWDDPATRTAIEKYMQSVRADAPWCPSNLEFIRRINGLDSIDDVYRIVFDASYLVLGLGDVYLGAPVATPLDPRHRLVTTKYNPARTWTPENAVGIGGAYLCIYGMEGPGGYQFVGRTVQMWNRHRQTADFKDGKQWLLRFFDQIRFFAVSAEELLELRADFSAGRYRLKTEEAVLRLRDYKDYLREHSASIDAFKKNQQSAFTAERERWRAAGAEHVEAESSTSNSAPAEERLPEGCMAVAAPVSGNVWQVMVAPGDTARADQELVVVEAMKMEIPLIADEPCSIVEVRCARGTVVAAGQTLLVIKRCAA